MTLFLQNKWKPVIIATFIIAVITIATRLFNLDLLISNIFYVPGESFPLKNNPLIRFFYFSINVSVTLSIIFVIAFTIAASIKKTLRKYKMWVVALFISMVVGPGLIVNSLFKDHFGRPRPSQSIEFGGTLGSKAILEANWGNHGKSFASGHAAVPLSFLVLAFLAGRRGKVKLAKQLTVGLGAWYLLVCCARIAAGGHYFSDVAWAGYVSFVCAWLSYLLSNRFWKNPDIP
ncbi:MAG: phosphatase PAP2 family protein [Psychromonas sp.]|nr:phosphatase PAP2 family protein [Psychromonas sp.]